MNDFDAVPHEWFSPAGWKPPMIDVIIVNFNSTRWVLRCLESFRDEIKRQRVKVIVQDNASSESLACIKEAFPDVLVRRNAGNIGFARAVNQALEVSGSEYVTILNPDTVVMEGFWPSSLEFMVENPQVGVLGPAILNPDGTVQGSARAFPGLLTALFGRNSPLSRLLPKNAITRANVLSRRSDGITPMEVDWVSGACMLVRRQAIKEVGMMDPRFFLYWEDADWCRRMWMKGWKIVYFPSAKVVHQVGASSSTKPVLSLYEFHRSSYKLFNKQIKDPFGLLSPFVAFALAMRFGLVLALRFLGEKKFFR
ncbi:MAG: glycosyltransferase family 2 protein [Deltaproteobacteria bacterium]|nr:glycosyltransferase family 2 protein [Deltaproteobacteria bacterium]